MSDIFMRNVFKQKECLEYVLQIIMEKQDLLLLLLFSVFDLHKKRKYSLDEKEEK